MLQIKGKVNTAVCFARVVEDEAIEQIRRMCESFHYDVVSLKRVRIANITIGKLRPGEYRIIKDHELENLYNIANGAGQI